MFLERAYKEIKLVSLSRKLLHACYELAAALPEEEMTNLTRQIKTAALDTHLRISQGTASRPRKDRLKYMGQAQQSLVIADAAFGFAVARGYLREEGLGELASLLNATYDGLDVLIDKLSA